MRVSPISSRSNQGGRSVGAGWLLVGRIVAFLSLLMLVLPAMPCEAAHAQTHLHGQAAGLEHAALHFDASAPSSDKADCGLHPCHACGCHAAMAVADAEPPPLPEPSLTAPRPDARFGEPRATAPPRRPPRA